MKIISLNVEKGKHYQKHKEFIIEEKPDILCLQELLEEDVEKYKNITKSKFVIFKPIIIAMKNGKKYKEGIAIFSKNPVVFSKSHDIFNYDNLPPISLDINDLESYFWKVLVVKIIENNKEITVANIHGIVTERGEIITDRQRKYFDNLLEILESYKNIVLVGDSNAPRGFEIFEKIKEKYRDNIPKKYTTSIDNGIHRVGFKNLQYVIDILFTDKNIKASNVYYKDGLSDHFAMISDIE